MISLARLAKVSCRSVALSALATTIAISSAASDSSPKIKRIDDGKRESVRAKLQHDIASGDEAWLSNFGSVTICGPRLWSTINPKVDKQGIEIIPTHFIRRGEARSQDGAVFKGAEGNRRLGNQLWPYVKRGNVQLPDDNALRRYWRIFPFREIEEPVFVVASTAGKILVHLRWDTKAGRFVMLLVEDLN